jgi:AraC-like DNA-binding protein
MDLNTEIQLGSIVEKGYYKLLKPIRNNSRIVLSKITKAKGELNSCNGYGLFVPLKGNRQYTTPDDQLYVSPQQYLILNYNQTCTLDINTEEQPASLNLRINKSYIDDAVYGLRSSTETLLNNPYPARSYNLDFNPGVFYLAQDSLGMFLSSIIDHLDITGEQLYMDENEVWLELAGHIVRTQQNMTREMMNLPAKSSATRKELYKRLNKAKHIISESISSPLEISTLAKEVALSESHFFRSFKSTFGISPHQYFLKKKFETAVHSLRKSTIPIKEIAYNVGFDDVSSFGRTFKQLYRLSPGNYRKKFQD